MNIVLISGVLSSDPVERELPSGVVLWQLELTTDAGSQRLSVPITTDDLPTSLRDVQTGDGLCVLGQVRRRFFRAAGSTQSRTEVVAIDLCRSTDRRSSKRLTDRAVRTLQSSDASPVRSTSASRRAAGERD